MTPAARWALAAWLAGAAASAAVIARTDFSTDLSAVLPRCAAIVHHGGIGTLAQAIAAGTPQLTMPMGFDQPDNATRLARLGIGRWVRPAEFTAEHVAAALRGLLDDPRTRESCGRWSAQLRQERAIDHTCDLLEQVA